MNVLYYYYYLFYTRVLPDNEPHATVIFTLSLSETLLIIHTIDFVGAHLFCRFLLVKWSMIGIFIAVILINYLIYHQGGLNKKVIQNKPKFYGSNNISCMITVLFFLVTTSFLFWMSDYLLKTIELCNKM
jgi:hypothetical protein